ncbi:xanthine dehydrogenase [Syncephalis fuscata]|nr:xanthine dehydrogenase [Syncephalis fuscata]
MTIAPGSTTSTSHDGARQSVAGLKQPLTPASLLFYVNGTRVQLDNPDPDLTLLQYLRHAGFKGTKLGCGEGGCGACTVMISSYNATNDCINHIPVNACLAPLCAMDGKHIITVEGIGKVKSPHPVQERIALLHGSQCGFCTPGIVMSLYTLLRNNPEPSEADIEEAFDGNLCRCTGYRPILDAAKTPVGCGLADCCQLNDSGKSTDIAGMIKPVLKEYDSTQEIIFPPTLANYAKDKSEQGIHRRLEFVGPRTTWHRPSSVDELLLLKHDHPNAKLIAGNTEIGVEIKFKHCHYPVLVHASDLPELSTIQYTEHGVQLGANITLAAMQAEFHRLIKTEQKERVETFEALLSNLEWFAGRQIRSVGTLAGNIATASPISDVNPILVAIHARLIVSSTSRGRREIPMTEFFLGYRKTALEADEAIIAVIIPFSQKNEYVRAYKQARPMRVQVCPETQVIKDITIAYGGMGPTTVMAKATSAVLQGGTLGDQSLLDRATDTLLQQELRLQASTPGGMPEYRMSLAASFLFRFWCDVSNQLGVQMASEDISGINEIKRGLSRGVQTYVDAQNLQSIGKSLAHVSAMKQVTGEAIYTDDIPPVQGEVYAAFVRSSKAHAKIISIDASEALAQDNVYGFYSSKDVPGTKHLMPNMADEPVFAIDEVICVGQPIGMIAAIDQVTAQRAARMVKVEYEELPHIITIEEAIEAKSFFKVQKRINKGDVDGEYRMGGQEHFYLETHGCIAIPKGEDGEMELISCTQNPSETQEITARVLGVPSSHVVCRVKRMGGGFGGKESRSVALAAALAVVAHNLNKPARCMLDRDEDMYITGQRHPFLGQWRAGISKDGIIQGVDFKLYSNGGCTTDLSIAVLDRATTHLDNAYYIPNIRILGTACRTNTPSNTAFRGFGGPQGMIVVEALMHQIADHLKVPVMEIQERNFYKEGQLTYYNQAVIGWHVPQMWEQLKASSDYAKRREEVDAFNRSSKWKKRGLAMLPTKYGISFGFLTLNQAGALVHVYNDGSVLLSHGGTEMGQGLHTKMIQICAEYLRIPVSSVHISETATDKVANTSPTAASASKPYRQKYPDATFAEIVHKAYMDRVNLSANGFYKVPDIGHNWETNEGPLYLYYTQGTAVSEVEVDILTGDHTVIRTDLMMDIGKSINYVIDVGQIEGALMQGIGWCTIEQSLTFPNGHMFTRGPGAYKLPGFRDIPQDMRIHIFKDGNYEHLKTINSSKGVGEPPLFLGASVIFAIRDALQSARRDAGCEESLILHSPATAERIRLACMDSIMTAARLGEADVGKPWVVEP